jgi:hypothetical protein
MHTFNIDQRNNLIIGTSLAAEIPASTLELKAYIVIGSYDIKNGRASASSRILNRDQDDLRFWLHKYEIDKKYLGSTDEIAEEQLVHNIFKNDIQDIEQLEREVEKYLDDFSLLQIQWKFDPPLPF